ncbi:MAG: hypothetical protein J6V06_00595 [Clostridia bacterium]|nr:hypothetical protein [Clostridia bacterium]
MKKILSVLLVILMLFTSLSLFASAASNNNDINTIINEFQQGDYIYDYYFYSPVKSSSDKTKYPIIIWLHGQLSGDYKGDQVRQSDVVYFATEENQAKIRGTKGAFVLVPRFPTLNIELAWSGENANIKKFVDNFIAEHKENVDTSRIYVGGYSMGGKAAMSFAATYPSFVAAIFPASSIYLLSSATSDLKALANTPAWFFTCKEDDFWGKPVPQQSDWNTFVSYSNLKSSVRWTQFDMPLYNYNGTIITSLGYNEHNTWDPIPHDLIMLSGSMYPNMTTINGYGGKVILKENNSFLSWLSSHSLNGIIGEETPDDDYDDDSSGSDDNNTGSGLIFSHIRGILEYVVTIFNRVFKRLFGYDF